jgi:transcriptional regulator with PAS, ATPase and Fis domain
MARALAEAFAGGAPTLTVAALVALLERAFREIAPVKTLSLVRPVGTDRCSVLDFRSVSVPVPRVLGAEPLTLTALLADDQRLEPKAQSWLELAACLIAVWLRAQGGVASLPSSKDGEGPGLGTANDGLIGSSDVMAALRERVCRFAPTDGAVLILGESGTGKELIARAIHRHGRRAHGAFLPVSCASLVSSLLEAEFFGIEEGTATGVKARKGKFELARGGTLFLDEVGDLSRKGQASLLRVLQERTFEPVGGHRTLSVDVRLVAATNRPLTNPARFRPELYYRLCVLPIHVPPLRERGRDVLELAEAFLNDDWRGWRWQIEPAAVQAFLGCPWPGNVRQLQSLLRLIQADADIPLVTLDMVRGALAAVGLAGDASTAAADLMTMRMARARHTLNVLQAHGGNKTRAAAALRISVPTLRAHLRPLEGDRTRILRRRAA